MNPAYYATNLQVYSGKSTFFSQALNVTIDKIYTYNDLTKTYTETTSLGESIMTQNTTNTALCSCSNYVKEVEYTVRVTPTAATT